MLKYHITLYSLLSAVSILTHSCFLHALSLMVMQLTSNLCPKERSGSSIHHCSPKGKFRIQNTLVPKILLYFKMRCLFVMKFRSFLKNKKQTSNIRYSYKLLEYPSYFSLAVRICWCALHSVFTFASVQLVFM